MHLLTLLCLLTPLTLAGQFALIEKHHTMSTACDLRLIDVCGCTKSLAVHKIWSCQNLPNVLTRGKICGGKWQLNTQSKNHTVRFEKPGCNEGCNLYSMHGSAMDEHGNEKRKGARCEGIRYFAFDVAVD
ncbi:MAG: hypothetical protein Q9226_001103 [Calogaya cf. arnoldii]